MSSLKDSASARWLIGIAIAFTMGLVEVSFANTLIPPTPTPGAGYVRPGSGGNASESGRDTGSNQMLGMLANLASAGMHTSIAPTCCHSKCGATCPNWAFAAMAAAAAANMGSSSGKSNSAGMAMAGWDWNMPNLNTGGSNSPGVNNPDGSNNPGGNNVIPGLTPDQSQRVRDEFNRIRDQLQGAGVKFENGKIITPDGKAFGPDSMSAEGLAALGYGEEDINKIMANNAAIGKKLNDKFGSKIGQLGETSGGGSAAGGGSGAVDYSSMFGGGGNKFAKASGADKKDKLSGLSKRVGDDQIGVAADNIWEMVTRRYRDRDAQNNFIKEP
ncbi:MAG TPA: hypothetical protein PLZ57_00395 [Pseudobdellovibrionaceae bacterium]|nr:hypothetical protein [Pseudobdellovibrionaceae bacterium]